MKKKPLTVIPPGSVVSFVTPDAGNSTKAWVTAVKITVEGVLYEVAWWEAHGARRKAWVERFEIAKGPVTVPMPIGFCRK